MKREYWVIPLYVSGILLWVFGDNPLIGIPTVILFYYSIFKANTDTG